MVPYDQPEAALVSDSMKHLCTLLTNNIGHDYEVDHGYPANARCYGFGCTFDALWRNMSSTLIRFVLIDNTFLLIASQAL